MIDITYNTYNMQHYGITNFDLTSTFSFVGQTDDAYDIDYASYYWVTILVWCARSLLGLNILVGNGDVSGSLILVRFQA